MPEKRFSLNISNKLSELCADCQKKFKEFIKNAGRRPTACASCQEKLKAQMYAARYPSR